MRTNQETLVVKEFTGCNNSIDKVKLPPSMVAWSHGGLYNQRGEFQRIPGKKAVSNSSNTGIVFSLTPLSFTGQNVLAVHHTTTITAVGSSELTVLRSPSDAINVMGPFIP